MKLMNATISDTTSAPTPPGGCLYICLGGHTTLYMQPSGGVYINVWLGGHNTVLSLSV